MQSNNDENITMKIEKIKEIINGQELQSPSQNEFIEFYKKNPIMIIYKREDSFEIISKGIDSIHKFVIKEVNDTIINNEYTIKMLYEDINEELSILNGFSLKLENLDGNGYNEILNFNVLMSQLIEDNYIEFYISPAENIDTIMKELQNIFQKIQFN